MTVKELLHRKVDDMSEEAAELLLEWIDEAEWADMGPLTPEQLAQLDRAMAQTDAGRVTPHVEVLRRFGRA